MLDEKGRLFGKINIIDLTVILVLLVVMAAGGFKLFYVNPEYQPVLKDVKMDLLVQGVRQPTVSAIQVGDRVNEKNSGGYFGTVTDIEVTPAQEFVPTQQGTLVRAELPGRYDIKLTVESQAEITREYVRISGQQIRIGYSPTIRTRIYEVETVVFALEIIE